jgi:hypothetical protein
LISIAGLFAQSPASTMKGNKTPEQRAERFTKKMTKELVLDAAQQERIKILNLDRFKKLEDARSAAAVSKKEVAAKVKQVNEEYFSNVKGVLTPEQFAKFQEMKEEMKEKAFNKKQGK